MSTQGRVRRWTVLAAVAAVLLVVVGGLALRSVRRDGDGSASVSTPTAPPGMRLAGRGRFVMEVPQGWTTDNCFELRYTTLICPGGPPRTTPGPPPPTPASVTILGDDGKHDGLHPGAPVGDASTLESALHCEGGNCWQDVVVPSQDVRVTIETADPDARATLDRFRASMRLLPGGLVAVPAVAAEYSSNDADRELADVGLKPVDDLDAASGSMTSEPAEGEIVPTGTTVTVSQRSPYEIGSLVVDLSDLNTTWLPVDPDADPHPLVFTPGEVSAYDGCEIVRVPFSLDRDSRMQITSDNACGASQVGVDGLASLQDAGTVELAAGRLVLLRKGTDEETVATYRRADEPEPIASGESFLVDYPTEVEGTWGAVGSPGPAGPLVLTYSNAKRQMTYAVGSCTAPADLDSLGHFRATPCSDPEAAGPVLDARALSLTSDGRLLLTDASGQTIASYAPVLSP